MHSNLRELQAKKKENAADDKEWRSSISERALPEILTATHDLNLGAQQLVPADQH